MRVGQPPTSYSSNDTVVSVCGASLGQPSQTSFSTWFHADAERCELIGRKANDRFHLVEIFIHVVDVRIEKAEILQLLFKNGHNQLLDFTMCTMWLAA